MPKQDSGRTTSQSGLHRWLGKYPGRTLLRLAATLSGLWLMSTALGLIWPKQDQVASDPSMDEATSVAPLPKSPVIIMLVGIDSNQLNDLTNQAAPMGPANADSLMLVKIEAKRPVELLQLPIELAVTLPGSNEIQPLAASYRQGGVALTADVISEIVGLPQGEPKRYVVIPRKALRTLIDGLGELEVNLNESIKRKDKAQNYLVNLQAGQQKLNGYQVEQLVRYRSAPKEEGARRQRQQWILNALAKQLQQPSTIKKLPKLLNELSQTMQTDLSQREWMSLTAAVLSSNQFPILSQLPLAPRAGEQTLRQLKANHPMPLWPNGN